MSEWHEKAGETVGRRVERGAEMEDAKGSQDGT